MAVYNKYGIPLIELFGSNGNAVYNAYDVSGNVIFPDDWESEITIQEFRNTTTNTTYYVVTIPKVRANGNQQCPFVYVPNGLGGSLYSTLQMNMQKGFYCAINGGRFFMGTTEAPIGTTIQNGVVIQQGSPETFLPDSQFDYQMKVLTIDSDGVLGYAEPLANADDLIASGVVSALHGFVPIVINSRDAKESIETTYLDNTADAQRQILGQKPNGDYVIITAEGRGYKNSTGWTIPQATQVCLDMGLKFAFNLDGGGSTETVISDEQINTIYEGTYGRKVPTYIVFNGTDEFFVPNP